MTRSLQIIFLTLFPILGALAAGGTDLSQYQEVRTPMIKLVNGMIVEGSLNYGGKQPNYLIDLKSSAVQQFFGEIHAEISDQTTRDSKIAIVMNIVAKHFGGCSYSGRQYSKLLQKYAENNTDLVSIGDFWLAGEGCCREFAIFTTIGLEEVGIESRYANVFFNTKYALDNVDRSVLDHSFSIILKQDSYHIVDAGNHNFNDQDLSKLMAKSVDQKVFSLNRFRYWVPKPEINTVLGSTRFIFDWKTPVGLQRLLSSSVYRIEEFNEIRSIFRQQGVRGYLFGGAAATYIQHVIADANSATGVTEEQFTSIFRENQDLDLVVTKADGSAETIFDLERVSAALEKSRTFQTLGKRIEVRGLNVPYLGKDALLHKDFTLQNNDSSSTGLLDFTSDFGEVKDLYHWSEDGQNYLQNFIDETIHFYRALTHQQTKLYIEGKNPEILGAIRFLSKTYQLGFQPDSNSLKDIQNIISHWNPKSEMNSTAVYSLYKNLNKLILNAKEPQKAEDKLRKIGLFAKVETFAAIHHFELPKPSLDAFESKGSSESLSKFFLNPLQAEDGIAFMEKKLPLLWKYLSLEDDEAINQWVTAVINRDRVVWLDPSIMNKIMYWFLLPESPGSRKMGLKRRLIESYDYRPSRQQPKQVLSGWLDSKARYCVLRRKEFYNNNSALISDLIKTTKNREWLYEIAKIFPEIGGITLKDDLIDELLKRNDFVAVSNLKLDFSRGLLDGGRAPVDRIFILKTLLKVANNKYGAIALAAVNSLANFMNKEPERVNDQIMTDLAASRNLRQLFIEAFQTPETRRAIRLNTKGLVAITNAMITTLETRAEVLPIGVKQNIISLLDAMLQDLNLALVPESSTFVTRFAAINPNFKPLSIKEVSFDIPNTQEKPLPYKLELLKEKYPTLHDWEKFSQEEWDSSLSLNDYVFIGSPLLVPPANRYLLKILMNVVDANDYFFSSFVESYHWFIGYPEFLKTFEYISSIEGKAPFTGRLFGYLTRNWPTYLSGYAGEKTAEKIFEFYKNSFIAYSKYLEVGEQAHRNDYANLNGLNLYPYPPNPLSTLLKNSGLTAIPNSIQEFKQLLDSLPRPKKLDSDICSIEFSRHIQ